MEHQFVDMYLRKKKGYSNTPATPVPVSSDENRPADYSANATAATIDRQVDRVVRGSFSVQQFVDRTDALSLQVETFEDKIVNLTKLVKLSQALQDEKESDLRKQNHELKSRLKRQEQITAKLTSDYELLKSQVNTMIRDAILGATNPIVDDLQTYARASQEGLMEQERRLKETREHLAEQLTSNVENMLSKRLSHLQESTINVVQQQSARQEAQIEQIEKRIETLDNHRLAELRRSFEDRLVSAIQLSRDGILAETKTNFHIHLDKVREDLGQLQSNQDQHKVRLTSLERQATVLDSALSDFLSTFKDSTKMHSDKTDEIAASVKEFMSLHEQTRSVVESELEGTKQWATRNLHRLKKHIDVINSDLLALRESHVETTSQLQRVKCQAESEHEKLLQLLQQKSREANILTEIVDKEIQSIHSITQQHRAHNAAPLSTQGGAHQLPSGGISSAAVNSIFSSAELEAPPSGRARGSGNLFDELAFQRRTNTNSQQTN